MVGPGQGPERGPWLPLTGDEMSKPIHDCPCCVCGQIELHWSDRRCWVSPEDIKGMADTIVACALDHADDRGRGVPWGLDSKLTDRLKLVVEKHLNAVRSDWLHYNVEVDVEGRQRLYDDIVSVLKEIAC